MDINYIIDYLTPERRVFYRKHRDKIQLREAEGENEIRYNTETGIYTVYGQKPNDISRSLDWICNNLTGEAPAAVAIEDLVEEYPMDVIPVRYQLTNEMMGDLVSRVFDACCGCKGYPSESIDLAFRYGYRAGVLTKYKDCSGFLHVEPGFLHVEHKHCGSKPSRKSKHRRPSPDVATYIPFGGD